jgi:hypothetical protein
MEFDEDEGNFYEYDLEGSTTELMDEGRSFEAEFFDKLSVNN